MQTIVFYLCYIVLIFLFSSAYNKSLIYCFVIWCLHTNKRRPCFSTLSGHPSSSCLCNSQQQTCCFPAPNLAGLRKAPWTARCRHTATWTVPNSLPDFATALWTTHCTAPCTAHPAQHLARLRFRTAQHPCHTWARLRHPAQHHASLIPVGFCRGLSHLLITFNLPVFINYFLGHLSIQPSLRCLHLVLSLTPLMLSGFTLCHHRIYSSRGRLWAYLASFPKIPGKEEETERKYLFFLTREQTTLFLGNLWWNWFCNSLIERSSAAFLYCLALIWTKHGN